MTDEVPFQRPWLSGREQHYIHQALQQSSLAAGGYFSQRCEQWLENHTGACRALLTASCSNALEISAVLINLQPGDEVILPSFTFTSTANAFVLRGAVPVFVDIRSDTLNIDESLIEAAITEKTRAIVPVHYAGAGCDMDVIMAIASKYNLWVIEDAAQCIGATWKGRPLGSIGHLGCYSFHATKNLGCGEGGALLVNTPELLGRAEIVHDKGTTRARFRAGKIRQYDWVDIGMSAPPSELQAAFLLAQLEHIDWVTQARCSLWAKYQAQLAPLSSLQITTPPETAGQNGHIFWILLTSAQQRTRAQEMLAAHGIQTALHYRPLHLAPAAQQYGKAYGALPNSSSLPGQLLRLPIWPELPPGLPELIKDILVSLR